MLGQIGEDGVFTLMGYIIPLERNVNTIRFVCLQCLVAPLLFGRVLPIPAILTTHPRPIAWSQSFKISLPTRPRKRAFVADGHISSMTIETLCRINGSVASNLDAAVCTTLPSADSWKTCCAAACRMILRVICSLRPQSKANRAKVVPCESSGTLSASPYLHTACMLNKELCCKSRSCVSRIRFSSVSHLQTTLGVKIPTGPNISACSSSVASKSCCCKDALAGCESSCAGLAALNDGEGRPSAASEASSSAVPATITAASSLSLLGIMMPESILTLRSYLADRIRPSEGHLVLSAAIMRS